MEHLEIRKLLEDIARYFSQKYQRDITYRNAFTAVFLRFADKLNMEHPVHMWSIDISLETAIIELDDFDFSCLDELVVVDGSIIPFGIQFQRRAAFKAAGENWIIHRYDADPFPSNPHAHNEDNNLKLDLRNGLLYRNRKNVGSVRKKELLQIRNAASMVFKGQLPALDL